MALLQIGADASGSAVPIRRSERRSCRSRKSRSAIAGGVRGFGTSIARASRASQRRPRHCARENARLTQENARLHELAAAYAAESDVRPVVDLYHGIEARVIGFPPENESRAVTIDKGSTAGVRRDDGVVAADGASAASHRVGPFSSTVVLITDYTSRIPAVVRRGRWWGIARGNLGSVASNTPAGCAAARWRRRRHRRGRSFHSGVPIGTVTAIERGDATLYQTAVLKPAVDLGASIALSSSRNNMVLATHQTAKPHVAPFVGPRWYVAAAWLAPRCSRRAPFVHSLAIRNVVPSFVLVVVVWYAIRVDAPRAAIYGLVAGFVRRRALAADRRRVDDFDDPRRAAREPALARILRRFDSAGLRDRRVRDARARAALLGR